MKQTYPAADIVAPKVHAHFERHLEDARVRGEHPLASLLRTTMPPAPCATRNVSAASDGLSVPFTFAIRGARRVIPSASPRK